LSQVSRHCDECWLPDSDGNTPMDIISFSNPHLRPILDRESMITTN
jgi:hypothetical protein